MPYAESSVIGVGVSPADGAHPPNVSQYFVDRPYVNVVPSERCASRGPVQVTLVVPLTRSITSAVALHSGKRSMVNTNPPTSTGLDVRQRYPVSATGSTVVDGSVAGVVMTAVVSDTEPVPGTMTASESSRPRP